MFNCSPVCHFPVPKKSVALFYANYLLLVEFISVCGTLWRAFSIHHRKDLFIYWNNMYAYIMGARDLNTADGYRTGGLIRLRLFTRVYMNHPTTCCHPGLLYFTWTGHITLLQAIALFSAYVMRLWWGGEVKNRTFLLLVHCIENVAMGTGLEKAIF